MEDFKFAKLSTRHKKLYITYQVLLFLLIFLMAYAGIRYTNPEIITTNDKMSVTSGAMIGVFVMLLAFTNRLKSLLKIKFVAFLIIWSILMSLQPIMDTLIWTIGLVLIPLMIDDIILLPIWRNLWYNNYE